MATAPYSYVTDGTSLDRDDFFERVRAFVRDQMLRACATPAHSSSTPPIVIGFQAPQGFGKTFLLNRLKMELGAGQLLTLSLDDFYFPAEQLADLASENPSYWSVRGLPGTHDVQLLRAVLEKVVTRRRARSLASGASGGEGEEKGEDTSPLLPRFDKTLRGGRGDRIADGRCQRLSASQLQSVRVVLLEGWCVGFSSDRRSAPAAADANGGSVEQRQAEPGEVDLDPLYEQGPATRLREQYEAVWREFISAWVIVELPLEVNNLFGSNSARALRWVVDWRQEAERKQSEATGRELMTAEEVEKFCEPYLACYRRCLPQLYEMGQALAKRQASADSAKNILRAVVQNEKRLVICLDEG
mmetsp:Transcript_7655/g.18504  ORF Transcript_7655/g.18504 Transcript_7655/m.18504 type:complete len:358 (+) Transcript_7655:456-1529(+)|eukprot:CAMPEP_0178988356 /NCGR_PEP_ID=MMETSP0795-20121207/3767_1 /TAXON_ID=88552 /ORGANISM="Amoebophrya sp., Strain Ameob2" /LENGTH=357 /DNA_ID=CAMNT_0020679625 /DNA_START=432 /DNA_END=1505 /DNA_ORIENTATION=+